MSAIGTGADFTIDGAQEWNTGTYTVTEESSPLDPADETGGFGQLTVTLRDRSEIKRMGGKIVTLKDGALGQTTGTIRGRSGDGLSASITAESRLGQLAVTRRAEPFTGFLDDAILYYLGLCGITTGIVIDSSFTTIPVALPGWEADVFEQINKKMAPAFGFEMSLVSNNVVIRPPRGREAVNYRDASLSWAFDETSLAQTVEGKWYDNEWRTDSLAYPPGGWSDDVTVYTVDAGETVVLDLEMNASLTSVQQPVCVLAVDRNYTSSSVYSVSGNDGLIIPPAQWEADGGSLKVEIGEDTKSLKVTIVGGRSQQYAPYSIAMASGTSDKYSSLRVVGTGVFQEEHTMTLPACQDTDMAPDEVGKVVENEFMATRDQLYHALLRSAARFTAPRQTISVKTKGINRLGDTGSAVYPTIGDLKAMFPGATIGDLATELGPTIADWNATLFESVANDFENQAFGNIAGARVLYDNSWYRIRNATIGVNSIDYQAERDNTIGDVYRTGETIGEWNTRWAGKTIGDVVMSPLENAPA